MAELQVVVYWECYADGELAGGMHYKRAEAEAYARAVQSQWDADHPGATASAVSMYRPCLAVRPVLCASDGHGLLFVLSREAHPEP